MSLTLMSAEHPCRGGKPAGGGTDCPCAEAGEAAELASEFRNRQRLTAHLSMSLSFIIQTRLDIFSPAEVETLTRYGNGFQRLMRGERQPSNAAQARFVQVCKNEVPPLSDYEKVWRKYLDRLEWERDPNNREAMGPRRQAQPGFGGSRQEYKAMHKAERADFWKRQRE